MQPKAVLWLRIRFGLLLLLLLLLLGRSIRLRCLLLRGSCCVLLRGRQLQGLHPRQAVLLVVQRLRRRTAHSTAMRRSLPMLRMRENEGSTRCTLSLGTESRR